MGLFVDLAGTFGLAFMQPQVGPIMPFIDWIFTECHKWEVDEGTAPNDTIVTLAKGRLAIR